MLNKLNLLKVVIQNLKKYLIKVVSDYDILFQEPKGLPPKREIQHEIHLQQDAPLLILVCTCLPLLRMQR